MRVEGSTIRWSLAELLAGWTDAAPDHQVTGLAMNTAEVRPGDAFLALPGGSAHGLDYLDEAIAAGATAVLYEPDGRIQDADIPMVAIDGLGERYAELAVMFYGAPAEQLPVVAVTGTNGKTSTAHFIAQCWTGKATYIGTLGRGLLGADNMTPSRYTTPDAVALQRALFEGLGSGADLVSLEASSHALAQGRLDGTRIEVGVFTNLSRDHLDFHGSENDYADAKARLFDECSPVFGVVNADDPVGREWRQRFSSSVEMLSFGLEPEHEPEVLCEVLEQSPEGMQLRLVSPWGEAVFRSELMGRFNASNLAAAAATLGLLGMGFSRLTQALELLRPVPGRMQAVQASAAWQPRFVVDYAHTPDALAQALIALREHCPGQLICVFGCGGDRDAGKRPMMGAAAESAADQLIITSDNPRGEAPMDIIDDVLAGLESPEDVLVEPDRAAAISTALQYGDENSVVLVAGKGHEDYQEIGGRRLPFSDIEQVHKALGAAA